MIPKTIHYCWFGRNPKSESVLRYIQTWKEKMPDYTIKEWNEENFDVNYNAFTQEAYFAQKYAFVSDVARLYALVSDGGIYLDTDIIVLKHFPDELLNQKGFAGFEHEFFIGTGVMACEKGNDIIREFLSFYETKHFFENFRFNQTPNVQYFTSLLKSKGLIINNKQQDIAGFLIYPQDIFCCKDCRTLQTYNNDKSLSIHDFAGTWIKEDNGISQKLKNRFSELITILRYYYRP